MIDYINNHIIHLTNKESDNLLTNGIQVELSKGSVFLDYGDTASKIAFVQTGLLEMVMNINDNEKIIEFIAPNTCAVDFFNYLLGKPSELQIRATFSSKIVYFKKQTLQGLLSENEKYKKVEQFIIEQSHFEFIQRLRWMYLPPKEKYEMFRKKYPELTQQIPQYKIASFLNISPEWLSKLRSSK